MPQSISSETYRQTKTGDVVTITYLPANPAIARIGKVDAAQAADTKRVSLLTFGFVATLFVGLTLFVEWGVRVYNKAQRP